MADRRDKRHSNTGSSNEPSTNQPEPDSQPVVNQPAQSGSTRADRAFGTDSDRDDLIAEDISGTGERSPHQRAADAREDPDIAYEQTSRQGTGGITNRSLDVERESQEAVPPRGTAKEEH
jgi:hypothetical protein